MPQPGVAVGLTSLFTPAYLKGMVINPGDPFKFDFIIYRGDDLLSENKKQEEYSKLIKYFLAALAVPDTDQWVNLSPYEHDRILPDNFGLTEMGRDLLAQDYLLKQISASLSNPDTDLGRKFWDDVYAKAYEKFGTTDIPTDTFNKVWITPDRAVIYEKGNKAFVIENHLKVMLESDYKAMKANETHDSPQADNETAKIFNDVMRGVIIPEIEKEVNTGRNFAPLRQVYSGMLLATWYKRALKESILGKLYADKSKVKGVDQDPKNNQRIYEEYVKAFKMGVFNMIKDDVDRYTQETIPRKYFAGGMIGVGKALGSDASILSVIDRIPVDGKNDMAKADNVSVVMVDAGYGRTPDRLMINLPTKNGVEKALEVKYPESFQYNGEVHRLSSEGIRPSIAAAFGELLKEQPGIDLEKVTGIEVVNPLQGAIVKKPQVIEIPAQLLVPLSEDIGQDKDASELARSFQDEMLKLLLFHEIGESLNVDLAQQLERDSKYIEGMDSVNLDVPYYPNALPANYHIVVPVFNEGNKLDEILTRIKSLGYLHKITFVNDASTDNSKEILDRWVASDGIEVMHLRENKKKEGAIREVLEMLSREGRLPEKVILLDSDSYLNLVKPGLSLQEMISQASAYMQDKGIAGMTFRMEPLLPEKPSILQKAQYAEYIGTRFWNRVSAKQGKLWVINGPAGMFRADVLLHALRNMVPDFETGDLLITVKLMEENYRVGYYTGLKVQTTVPNTVKELFKQRRRWERGTLKVFVDKFGFYMKQFHSPNILALQTAINFMAYVFLTLSLPIKPSEAFSFNAMVTNYFLWLAVNVGMSLSVKSVREEREAFKVTKWLFLQGLVYTGVVMPARFAGVYDAMKFYIVKSLKKSDREPDQVISRLAKETLADFAQNMMPVVRDGAKLTPGGIDMSQANLDLQIKRDGDGVPLPVNQQNFDRIHISGLVPVILAIKSADPVLLGFNQ